MYVELYFLNLCLWGGTLYRILRTDSILAKIFRCKKFEEDLTLILHFSNYKSSKSFVQNFVLDTVPTEIFEYV